MQIIRRALLLCLTTVFLGAGLSTTKAADEKIWHVKAVHPEGRLLDVKAVDKDGKLHAVKAISPEGRLYDVKGIKLGTEKAEGKVNGVEFAAHLKALPQAP